MNIKPIDDNAPLRTRLSRLTNHGFLLIGVVFMVQQGMFRSSPPLSDAQQVQALHLQPRTPPPALDPDQLTDSELDPTPSFALDSLANSTPSTTHGASPMTTNDAGTAPVTGPILTREDAPDREARALPARMRRE